MIWKGGTQGYQSPEIIVAGSDEFLLNTSSAVDLWAACIVLVQLVMQIWMQFLPCAISQGTAALMDTLEQLVDPPILNALHKLRDQFRGTFPRSVQLPAGNGEPSSPV
eukprot:1376064-Rhodomonas_salina.1